MDWKFENGRIYSMNENNELMAEATFSLKENGVTDINHTYVNPALRGQGVAGKMMEVVADYFREKEFKATASCSYANAWLKKHQDSYSDIISNDINEEAIACKIDTKH